MVLLATMGWFGPAGLRGEVATVGRISSFGQVRAEGVPVGGLGPGGFADAYDLRPLWNRGDLGQGQTIVFFEVDGYSPADLAAYDARFGLPAAPSPLPHIGPLNLKPAGESDMDIQAAHAIAPQARLVYVNLTSFGGKNASAAATFQRAFSTVARDYPGAIWSMSLGQCEDIFSPTDLAAADGAVAAAERAGTTAFAASGDEGGLECLGVHQQDARIPARGISFPGDLPAVTSVGGTTLALTPAGQYLGETAWTEPLLSQGSTGGPSVLFPAPPWQRAPGVASQYADGTSCGSRRLLPGGAGRGRGRRAADRRRDPDPRPVAQVGRNLAGHAGVGRDHRADEPVPHRARRPPAGFVNPLLYRLARGSPPYRPFHEVTAGTNDFYPAGPGYNMVTGLGTPDAWNLVRDLAPLTGRAR